MRSELTYGLACTALIACGGSSSPDQPDEPDAGPVSDAPPDVAEVETAQLVVLGVPGGLSKVHVYAASSDAGATELRAFRSFSRPFSYMTSIQISGNEIFICDQFNIQVFDLDADGSTDPNGSLFPKRFIEGPDSQVSCTGMFVYGGEIYETATGGKLIVHELEASGASPPLRTISSSAAQYHWVQVSGSEIYAATTTAIDVFPIDAHGVVSPTRTIRNIELDEIRTFHVTDTELFVVNGDDTKLRVFDAAADGVVEPLRVLKGLPAGSRTPKVVGNELFVAFSGAGAGDPTMTGYSVFDVGAADFAEPLRRVTLPDDVGVVQSIDAH